MTDVFTILRRTARRLTESPSGGSGLVGPDDDDSPADAAQRSPSTSAPHRP